MSDSRKAGFYHHALTIDEAEERAATLEDRTTEALVAMIESVETRVGVLERDLPGQIAEAVRAGLASQLMTSDETAVMRMIIERQRQSVALRKAIIEKTVPGLVWAGVTGVGYLAWEIFKAWLKDHGLKINP